MEKRIKALEKKVGELDERTKRIGQEVREANLRAKEAHVGYVETSVELRYFKGEFNDLKKSMRANTRWLIGLFISILGLIVTIVSFILKLKG